MSLFQTLIQIQKTDNEEMNELDKNTIETRVFIKNYGFENKLKINKKYSYF
jgi:hypothetical protein